MIKKILPSVKGLLISLAIHGVSVGLLRLVRPSVWYEPWDMAITLAVLIPSLLLMAKLADIQILELNKKEERK